MKQVTKLSEIQKNELLQFIKKRSHSSKEVQRAQAVLLIDRGMFKEITEVTSLSLKRAFTLRAGYRTGGITALYDRPKGKPKRLLTEQQRRGVTNILKDQNPAAFGYGKQPGWTTAMLGAVIEQEYGVVYKSKTSLYLIFKASKLSYHLPVKHYERKNAKEVAAWKTTTLPIVQKAWGDQTTVVLAEDEMSLSSQTTTQKVWLPAGEQTDITISQKRECRSLYGFLNIKTGQEHAFKTLWQNMFLTVGQLIKIRKIYPNQHLLILWDQAGWHKGSAVKQWIEEDKNTEVYYFPAAAPDENPQEHVWKAGRAAVTHNRFIPKIDEATDMFVAHINAHRYPYKLLGFSAPVHGAVS